MKKTYEKTNVVEAVQLTPDSLEYILGEFVTPSRYISWWEEEHKHHIAIRNEDGIVVARTGDYIVQDPHGGFLAVNPHIFHKLYKELPPPEVSGCD